MKLWWVFFVVCVCVPGLGCSSNNLDTLPIELLGKWETMAPKYDGFSFEITEKSIIFWEMNVKNQKEIFSIKKKTKDIGEDNTVLYTLLYDNEEDLELRLAFYYNPSREGEIILKNQSQIVWKKIAKK